jgi:hypothetical protein
MAEEVHQATVLYMLFEWAEMNKALDYSQRRELWAYIKLVASYYKEDDIEWLKEYSAQMVETYGLQKSLSCFKNLSELIKI